MTDRLYITGFPRIHHLAETFLGLIDIGHAIDQMRTIFFNMRFDLFEKSFILNISKAGNVESGLFYPGYQLFTFASADFIR